MKIPFGASRTYTELASDIGIPGAARAVGNALSKNRIPILIPCHRVIRSDGHLGGYAGGIKIKEKLLQIEKEQK
ncbi:MAG: MGMT family protein [FCB group bacterium]|nr:MGMT family protein [FCB group bacterium]